MNDNVMRDYADKSFLKNDFGARTESKTEKVFGAGGLVLGAFVLVLVMSLPAIFH